MSSPLFLLPDPGTPAGWPADVHPLSPRGCATLSSATPSWALAAGLGALGTLPALHTLSQCCQLAVLLNGWPLHRRGMAHLGPTIECEPAPTRSPGRTEDMRPAEGLPPPQGETAPGPFGSDQSRAIDFRFAQQSAIASADEMRRVFNGMQAAPYCVRIIGTQVEEAQWLKDVIRRRPDHAAHEALVSGAYAAEVYEVDWDQRIAHVTLEQPSAAPLRVPVPFGCIRCSCVRDMAWSCSSFGLLGAGQGVIPGQQMFCLVDEVDEGDPGVYRWVFVPLKSKPVLPFQRFVTGQTSFHNNIRCVRLQGKYGEEDVYAPVDVCRLEPAPEGSTLPRKPAQDQEVLLLRGPSTASVMGQSAGPWICLRVQRLVSKITDPERIPVVLDDSRRRGGGGHGGAGGRSDGGSGGDGPTSQAGPSKRPRKSGGAAKRTSDSSAPQPMQA